MANDALDFGNPDSSFKNQGHTVRVTKVAGPDNFLALVWRSQLVIDWDGSPRAYGWNNPADPLQQKLDPEEKDHLANAASPWQHLWHNHDFEWAGLYSSTPSFAQQHNLKLDRRPQLEARRGIAAGKEGKFPVVQTMGAWVGYYVSKSSAVRHEGVERWQPSRYLDASAVPYCVLPDGLANHFPGLPLVLGDCGLAIANGTGTAVPFFFGDTRSSSKHLGEVSGALAQALFPPSGKSSAYVSFLVFPRSGLGRIGGSETQCDLVARREVTKLSKAWNVGELELLLTYNNGGRHGYTPSAAGTDPTTASITMADTFRKMNKALYEANYGIFDGLSGFGYQRPPLRR